MKQLSTLRKHVAVIVAVVLAACFFFVAGAAVRVKPAGAETTEYDANWTKPVSITNSQFSDVGSGDIPAPNNWTGASLFEHTGSAVKSGVLKLDEYNESNKDNYKLDIYDEYKTATPDSPFGRGNSSQPGHFEGTNRNVLLINANGADTAFGYTSDSFTLSPSSYYKISVWAKTGGLSANSGASIVIGGVTEETAGFKGEVDTNGVTENKGWAEYVLYVETSAYKTATATLGLQLGSDEVNSYTKGYVMFDNIVATEITYNAFYNETRGIDGAARKTVVSALEETPYMTGGDFETAGAFGSIGGGATTIKEIANAANGVSDDNKYGLEKQLYAPFDNGKANNVFVVSTYNNAKSTFDEGYGYVESNVFALNRYSYYRISAWYDGENVEGGDGINATLFYKHKNNSEFTEAAATGLTVSTENYNHYGWSELTIYVKGSDVADGYEAKLRLGLGTESNPSKGVAMFDEVKIAEITPAEYGDLSSAGSKAVTIDTFTDSTGITNGAFNTVGTYDEIEFTEDGTLKTPLAPSGWTKYTVSEVGTSGYSLTAVDTENVVSGLVPVSEFDAFETWGNALKLSSSTDTAFCYRSSDFTVSASSYNTLAIKLEADNLAGYGANLVLKRGGKVVATIEKITQSGTHTFYIKGGEADATMCVELWLGLNDRDRNETKLASGTVYFTEVAFASDSTEEVFTAKSEQYAHQRTVDVLRNGIHEVVVSLGTEDLSLYDSYDEGVKTPYNWTLSKGSGVVKYGVDEAEGALMLKNVTKTYSTVTLDNTFALKADSYYKFSMKVMTRFEDEDVADEKSVGAYVKLTNGDYRFDFKSTAVTVDSVTDNNAYRTYTFYIKSASTEGTTAVVLGLGGSEKSNQAIAGTVYIKDIVLEDISNVDYEDVIKDLKDDENAIDDYTMRVNLAAATDDSANDGTDSADDTTTDDTTASSGEIAWWLIPSILLAVAVVIAVVGSIIKNAIVNRPKKVDNKKRSSYDRRNVVHGATAAKPADKATGAEQPKDDFEKFNDTEEVPATDVTETPVETPTDNAEATETAETETAAEATDEEAITETEAAETTTEEVPAEEVKAEEPAEVKIDAPAEKKEYRDGFDD